MGTRSRRCRLPRCRLGYLLGIALLVAVGGPSSGRAQPLVAIYDAFWAGLPAARIRLDLGQGGASYQDAIAISSDGLPRLVTRFRGIATAEGRLGPALPAEPMRYDAVYDLGKRHNSHISMRFVRRGGVTIAERGRGDTSHKPPLEEVYRRDAVDPLSALERIREAVRAALHGGGSNFTVPVYDGARRFDVRGRVLPKSDRDHTLQIVLTLRPIAGFRGESSDDGDPGDAPRSARLVVGDDARLLPLSFEVPVYYLPLVVRLDHLCPVPLSCSF
jgi:Protein of unknown function (DUF3108)